MIVDRGTFFEIQSKFQDVPFDQTEEWLDSLCLEENILLYFVNRIERTQLCCWGVSFKRHFIGKHLVIEGLSVKDSITSEDIKIFFKDIISEGFGLIEISDIGFYDSNYEVGIRRAGFIRPLGLSLSPLTIIVKLQEPFAFHRDWRRNVKKCVEQGVKFISVDNPTIHEAEIFVNLFNELKERKRLGFNLTSDSLMKLFTDGNYKLFFVQDKDGKYLSGRIEYVSGPNVYDVYAANSYKALKCGSAYFIQEEIFKNFKRIGLKTFDYGRVPPSADHMDGIYTAKSFSGGELVLYNGQWQYSKSLLFNYAYSFYKHYLHKQRLY